MYETVEYESALYSLLFAYFSSCHCADNARCEQVEKAPYGAAADTSLLRVLARDETGNNPGDDADFDVVETAEQSVCPFTHFCDSRPVSIK